MECMSKLNFTSMSILNKINSSVLHPGNKKQYVTLILAVLHETTIAGIRLYLPKEKITAVFYNLIRSVNSKERFHPLSEGKGCSSK